MRHCKKCKCDISSRPPKAKYCLKCAEAVRYFTMKSYHKERGRVSISNRLNIWKAIREDHPLDRSDEQRIIPVSQYEVCK